MKRGGSDPLGAPPLKRVNSALTDADDDDDKTSEHFFLRSQNKALALHVKKGKVSFPIFKITDLDPFFCPVPFSCSLN